MPLFNKKKELARFLQEEERKNHSIGFVPTMGALHEGHLALVQQAFSENDKVVVSIFVNPTQFHKKDDLEKYPRDLERDLEQLRRISDDIAVFAPSADEMYKNNVEAQFYDFEGIEKAMEGAHRPGHFQGVATIVELLLRTVAPHKAYFGEKDFQQLQIVRKMVALKNLPCTIIGCATKRETNGLAMSSRNERLSKTTKEEAGLIYQILSTAKTKFATDSITEIIAWATARFEKHPTFTLEYFQIADEDSLTPQQEKQKNVKYRAFVAAYAEGVRLIDNLELT